MDNRFKFRAWHKTFGMCDISWINFYTGEICCIIKDDGEDTDIDCFCNIDEIILMQSTGLKDKNGKMIFEGDIVRNKNNCIAEIGWSERKEAIRALYCDCDCYISDTINEIIGNIYETPELLGSEDK